MWKCAFSFTVAELKNRLDTMNTKPNRKHVDNMQSFAVYTIQQVEKDNLWHRTGGFRWKRNPSIHPLFESL